eukprot:CAMPEP_0115745960 /NCGR_PEP_ID=MMETSP0272-20121206/92386_1 /TAXON_ID=71861 /ORGANISM="Scrippsiella trochoidea, Strain CCMP3099" /LENGTH=109 /DNA_ID=CAMNT_0003190877 /DNA_START=405 /DNA_END=730 /DNA_ORIENTATION=-
MLLAILVPNCTNEFPDHDGPHSVVPQPQIIVLTNVEGELTLLVGPEPDDVFRLDRTLAASGHRPRCVFLHDLPIDRPQGSTNKFIDVWHPNVGWLPVGQGRALEMALRR